MHQDGGGQTCFSSRQYQPASPCFSEVFLFVQDKIPLSHLSQNELELLIQEAEEASGAGYKAAFGGAAALAGQPAPDQPRAKGSKCAFAGAVDMPEAATELYERWTQWRDHVSASLRAFVSDDVAARKDGEYHVELMHRGLAQTGVDVATSWAAPSAEPGEALLVMALYKSHARWKPDALAACGVCCRARNLPSWIPRVGHRAAHLPSASAVVTSD